MKIERPTCQQHIEIESPAAEAEDAAKDLEFGVRITGLLAWLLLIIGALLAAAAGADKGAVTMATYFSPFLALFILQKLFARLAGIHAALLRLQK